MVLLNDLGAVHVANLDGPYGSGSGVHALPRNVRVAGKNGRKVVRATTSSEDKAAGACYLTCLLWVLSIPQSISGVF